MDTLRVIPGFGTLPIVNIVLPIGISFYTFQTMGYLIDVYRAKVIDYTTGEMCIEVTGDPSKIDAFISLMKPFGIIEMCRTGIVALERGSAVSVYARDPLRRGMDRG